MKRKISRRTGMKWVTAGTLVGLGMDSEMITNSFAQEVQAAASDAWSQTHDRVWLGGEFWANPMEDWVIKNGAAECQSVGARRSVHSTTHQITNPSAGFSMSVNLSRVAEDGSDGGAGFRVGIQSDLNEYRSNCFAGGGIDAGIVDGKLVLGRASQSLVGNVDFKAITLELTGVASGNEVELKLVAKSGVDKKIVGEVTQKTPADRLLGNVAVVNNYLSDNAKPKNKKGGAPSGSRYRFSHWTITGDAFTVSPEHRFGPILWTMYSLSDSSSSLRKSDKNEGFVMKLSALTGPLSAEDSHTVELLVQRDGEWKSLGEATLDPDAWVATFRIANWDESVDTPYKVVYNEKRLDGTVKPDEWTGTIKANPVGRPLRMAAMTCQNDYGFPYEPVANNVAKLDPDLAYFSGDQIYEGHGGFGIIRDPADRAILNYLRKFYQFGWAFRNVMRNCPTLCLPDDHDVFQGNIWGEGGAKMELGDSGASSKGGYREPARMVNAVHLTNVGHHPDAYDATPVKQDISVYYGDMIYGGVSFAIIADRQWKSGPERVDTGSGRADHVLDPEFDCSKLDKPGLVLLGDRQEDFLKLWAKDWRGHSLKCVLSQTVFAGVATHHGGYDGYLKGDLDSGAWPQTPRNRAIEILRESMALHINGDQHLTSLCQYGVSTQRDSNWSFCTPAISAGYPRWWRPDEVGMPHANRPEHGNDNTGEYLDSFGNRVYVYAVGNPVVGKDPNRYKKAHEKASGFGFVTFDTKARTYKVESFRFLIDATDGAASNQFPGWPVTIQQAENRGENQIK